MTRPPAVVAFAAIAAATVAVARSAPDLALAGNGGVLAAEIAAAGLVVLSGRPALVAAGCAWLLAEWNSPGAGMLFTPGLVLYAAWPALLAYAALGDRRVALAGALAGVGILGVATAVVFDPAGQGCADCPANHVRVAGSPDAVRTLGHVGLALTVAWIIVFCAGAVARLVRDSPVRRRLRAPILVPATLAIALFGADAAHGLGRGYLSNDATDRALRMAQAAALALTAGGIALEQLRLRRTRGRVAHLVLEIGAAPAPGELRARLAESLGDPDLALLHSVDGAWIDEAGRTAALPGAATIVRAGGEDVLAVVHRRGLLDDPQLVDELATTARLAIEHERLEAAHRARLEELRASRERIVDAADRERRALERDLHDGAQQRLVTLGLSIRLTRRRQDDERLATAEEHVRAAVVDVREVAHGLFPTVLADEGLGPAIDVLSEQAPRLVARRLPTGRFPDAVESAAYFAAREALRLTDREVTVDAFADDVRLSLTIAADDALDGAMTQIQDRVGAVGGTVVTRRGQLILEMPIPERTCAS